MEKLKKSTPKKIVIVEDDPEILDVINLLLGLDGYDVSVLSNGKPIMNNQIPLPDLYILDKMLPYANGTDICHFLKTNLDTMFIPVIIISATPCRDEAYDAGAIYFIEKPFSMHTFLNTVADALQVDSPKWFA